MRLIFIFIFILSFLNISDKKVQVAWPEPTMESKPWTRWWWPGNAVDKENIKREFQELSETGIGGVEITPIYGVKGEEDRFIEFLSPEFSELLKFTIAEAAKLGMGVDLPPGSGWRCGGPFVPEEKGLWNLEIEKTTVAAGETWVWPAKNKSIEAALFVSNDSEAKIIIRKTNFTASQNGSIYSALRIKSGDKVKRAAEGGKGWAIDTFNKEITRWYLDEFWKRLGIDEGLIRCFFHDSFEYTGDFTTNFMSEFKNRRGYDLTEYLNVLYGDCESEEIKSRVRSDYRETLAELVLEAFIQPMTDWTNGHKSLNRNQAHGSPGNILDLYAACDIPETEIFRRVQSGTPNYFIQKFASSAGHVTGKKLVSSESFTWLEEQWNVTTSDMVRATNRFFLSGINHMFFHGTCYSPKDAKWPGWLFYASTQVNDRNPLWREFPALFKYIERTQTVLQQTTSQNDLLVYWPYYDVAASDGTLFNHIGVSPDTTWFTGQPINALSKKLQKMGYTFDYISDKQLMDCSINEGEIESSGKTMYKAIVIPKTRYMPLKTLEKLRYLAKAGGIICFDQHLPENTPGMFNLAERERDLNEIKDEISNAGCTGDIFELLDNCGIQGEESIVQSGLYYIKQKKDNDVWYWLVNTGIKPVDEWIELNSPAKNYVLFDPMNGEISQPLQLGNSLRIQVEPERGIFVRCTGEMTNLPEFVYTEQQKDSVNIEDFWKIEFAEGGPVFPGNISTKKLTSWTKMGDTETQRFAGTANYKTEFIWDNKSKSAVLNLGEVRDCARIILNNEDYGTLLGPTYKIKVNNLKKGKNLLQVEVTNVAANRIRDLDRQGVNWKKFYDINFVNINYEPFDASDWEIRDAGLLGPVRLFPL